MMMLYEKTIAITIKQVVIGSIGCRHSNSSMVLASIANTPTLCEIQYFAKCELVPVAHDQTQLIASTHQTTTSKSLGCSCRSVHGSSVQSMAWKSRTSLVYCSYYPQPTLHSHISDYFMCGSHKS